MIATDDHGTGDAAKTGHRGHLPDHAACPTSCAAQRIRNETLGAQQLKTQYGSTRIRDKQQELVRLARDLVEITSEIITEKFDPVTIIEMSQTQLPTQQMKQQQMKQIQQGLMQGQQQLQQQPAAARLSRASRRNRTRKPSRSRR